MIKKFALLLLVFTALLAPRANSQVFAYSSQATFNSSGTVKVVPSALITVCASTAVNTPCSPTITIYSSLASAPKSNPFNADVNGNFLFFVPSGNYVVSITGVGVQGYSYIISVGGTGSGGTVTHTGGPLTVGQLVIGNGGADTTVGNLSGDVSTSGGTTTTLASVGSAGSCGDATHSCAVTFDAKGRETAQSNNAITFPNVDNCNQSTKTANYTLAVTDCLIYANASAGGFTLTLPHAVTAVKWRIVRTDTTSNVLTIVADSGNVDNGASEIALSNANLIAQCDGTNCWTTPTPNGILGRSISTSTDTVQSLDLSPKCLTFSNATGTTETVPDVNSTGFPQGATFCGIVENGAGITSWSRTSTSSFVICNGVSCSAPVTSFQMFSGQFATFRALDATNWTVTLNNSCPDYGPMYFNAACYGVGQNGPTKFATDASLTLATPTVVTITASDPPFTAGNNNMACGGLNSSGSNVATVGTFTFTDATHGSCSGGSSASIAGAATFFWGPDETANARAVVVAAEAGIAETGTCVGFAMDWPPGLMWLTKNPFREAPPTACAQFDDSFPGFFQRGMGEKTSTFFMAPNFDLTSGNPGSCTYNISGSPISCIFGWPDTIYKDFGITGLGWVTNPASIINILNIQHGSIVYGAAIYGIMFNQANAFCFNVNGQQNDLYDTFVDGACNTSYNFQFTDQSLYNAFFTSQVSIASGASVVMTNVVGTVQTAGVSRHAISNAGQLTLLGNTQITHNSNDGFCGINMGGVGTGKLILTDSTVTATGTNNIGICFTANNQSVHFKGSNITGSVGHGALYGIGFTGNSFFDDCGNTVTNNIPANVTAPIFGSCSITGIVQTAGNFADGTGLGTSTFGTVTGDSRHGQVTVTYAGALTTTPIFTMTFPTPFWQTPTCTLQDVGGTNAFPTSIANGTISTTSATFNLTFAVAPTAGNTDIFVWNCSN